MASDALLFVNQKFSTFDEFDDALVAYQNKHKQLFVVRGSRLLAETDAAAESLKYSERTYRCKFFGTCVTKSRGIRETKTFKCHCPAYIRIAASKEKDHLVVRKIIENHLNHDGSEEFYEYLPRNRQLRGELKDQTLELLRMKCPKKYIQDKLDKENNLKVKSKDLDNIARELRNIDDDNLSAAVHLLENTYHAKVGILHENKQFKGLYFSTEDMRQDVSRFPEIIFIDGTYKLFKRKFTLMLIVMEDGDGETRYGGVGILADEERVTLRWMLESFNTDNPKASENIRCFMSDKDVVERSVIKEIFPDKPTYICLFHTLRTLGREVSCQKMHITIEERHTCLGLLEKMAKSKSENEYIRLHEQLSRTAPQQVLNYFNRNWHSLKTEWTLYNMVHGNLGNTTNNRLESLNGKLQDDLDLHNTLVEFVHGFFTHLGFRERRSTFKRVDELLRHDNKVYPDASDEVQYKNVLTRHGFEYVINEIEKLKSVTIREHHDETMECKIGYIDRFLQVSPTKCECGSRTSMLLPCRHIFAVRTKYGLPLFDEKCIHPRWIKRQVVQKPKDASHTTTVSQPGNSFAGVVEETTVTEELSETRKQSMLRTVLDNILFNVSRSPQDLFECQYAALKEFETCVSQRINLCVTRIPDLEDQQDQQETDGSRTIRQFDTQMGDVSIRESDAANSAVGNHATASILEVQLPAPEKIVGRPRSAYSTNFKTIRK